MTISTLQQVVEVTDVSSVVASDIVESQDDVGNPIYIREFRVYASATALLFTLRAVADTSTKLELTAPVQTY